MPSGVTDFDAFTNAEQGSDFGKRREAPVRCFSHLLGYSYPNTAENIDNIISAWLAVMQS